MQAPPRRIAGAFQVFSRFGPTTREKRDQKRFRQRPLTWVDPCDLEGWYRYGDSNPGPVAENHVS